MESQNIYSWEDCTVFHPQIRRAWGGGDEQHIIIMYMYSTVQGFTSDFAAPGVDKQHVHNDSHPILPGVDEHHMSKGSHPTLTHQVLAYSTCTRVQKVH